MIPTERTQLSKSLLAQVGPAGSIADILAWLQERNRQVTVDVELVNFDRLTNWHFNAGTGDLEHDSGKF